MGTFSAFPNYPSTPEKVHRPTAHEPHLPPRNRNLTGTLVKGAETSPVCQPEASRFKKRQSAQGLALAMPSLCW